MSDFSTLCRETIKDAGLTVYKISKYSGLDRTTIQKMLSEDKLPSYPFFYRFLDQLRTNVEERQKLLEEFEIAKDGAANFRNRRKILEIIRKLGQEQEYPRDFAGTAPAPRLASGEQEVY